MPGTARETFVGVDRIVSVGDLHGDFAQFRQVLMQASLIDADLRWTGDRTHLVQLGDVADRGPDTRRIIELLMRLEKEASRAGGRIHALVANHEAMNIVGDLRFVHSGEYAAFADNRSERRRKRYLRAYADSLRAHGEEITVDDAFIAEYERQFPLGWVEHRSYWEPGGRFARWVAKHNTVIRINDVLFMHAD